MIYMCMYIYISLKIISISTQWQASISLSLTLTIHHDSWFEYYWLGWSGSVWRLHYSSRTAYISRCVQVFKWAVMLLRVHYPKRLVGISVMFTGIVKLYIIIAFQNRDNLICFFFSNKRWRDFSTHLHVFSLHKGCIHGLKRKCYL